MITGHEGSKGRSYEDFSLFFLRTVVSSCSSWFEVGYASSYVFLFASLTLGGFVSLREIRFSSFLSAKICFCRLFCVQVFFASFKLSALATLRETKDLSFLSARIRFFRLFSVLVFASFKLSALATLRETKNQLAGASKGAPLARRSAIQPFRFFHCTNHQMSPSAWAGPDKMVTVALAGTNAMRSLAGLLR